MADSSMLLAELAEEFAARVRQGHLPEVEEYAVRHPELAERIRALFPTLRLLEGMAAGGAAVHEPGGSGLGPGCQFGAYRIERELGRGGMGVVYEAVHLALNRRVALKVLPAEGLSQANHLERFLREAQTAAGLHHTNIVPVFDVGQVGGITYYAMQLIRGIGLDRFNSRDDRAAPSVPDQDGGGKDFDPARTTAEGASADGSAKVRRPNCGNSRPGGKSVRWMWAHQVCCSRPSAATKTGWRSSIPMFIWRPTSIRRSGRRRSASLYLPWLPGKNTSTYRMSKPCRPSTPTDGSGRSATKMARSRCGTSKPKRNSFTGASPMDSRPHSYCSPHKGTWC
jgi:Protein kinase domain